MGLGTHPSFYESLPPRGMAVLALVSILKTTNRQGGHHSESMREAGRKRAPVRSNRTWHSIRVVVRSRGALLCGDSAVERWNLDDCLLTVRANL